ncbi:MAG: YggS family pyridoxal phosphate-dependent enzyme [Treponema sp.]|nr:YggS family pyridoxal phosphate-dependent enzyme [Treponema sp.]MCL2237287.1 YggS family pyridoxal phosphate-dependent enzyme [Treponema sp.]
MSVAVNLAKIEDRILKTCIRAGRKREEITLMGVSKFVPLNLIDEAFASGVRCFGESRVKEASVKFVNWKNRDGAQIHLIGSLQRNKAKNAAQFFDCIQSADRDELIVELSKHAHLRANLEKPLKVFLEMHTGEETKSGYENLDALLKAAELLLESGNLEPAGLMTMAPWTADTGLIRSSFRQLAKAKMELEKRFSKTEWRLSMGMSNDFEIAIEEGSNLLRIGSAIFKD